MYYTKKYIKNRFNRKRKPLSENVFLIPSPFHFLQLFR